MAPSCRGRVNCHQMPASGKPRRKTVRQARSRSEESEVRPRPDMHLLYTFAPRRMLTCGTGSARREISKSWQTVWKRSRLSNNELPKQAQARNTSVTRVTRSDQSEAISTRPTFPCSSANTGLKSERELRKSVESVDSGHSLDHHGTARFDPQETFVPRQRMVGPARKRSFAPDRRPCLRQDHVSSSSSAFASFRSAVSKPSVNQP
jgi:hypothetical protein